MLSNRPSIAEANEHRLNLLKEMFISLLPPEQSDYFNQRWQEMSGNLPSLQIISNVVCQEFDISIFILRGTGGKQYVSDARKVYARIAYDIGYKWEDIGTHIFQSHSAVLQAANQLNNLIVYDDVLREKYQRVKQTITEIT